MSTETSTPSANASAARLALIGLLLVQIFVGYEWFNSGLTKIVRGGFPNGLASTPHRAGIAASSTARLSRTPSCSAI